MNEKRGKTKNIRLSSQLLEDIRRVSSELGISQNELIVRAINDYCSETNNAKIAHCPECRVAIADVERIPIAEGVSHLTCKNKHTHAYDFRKQDWV